jgi:hypothetical protein
VPPGTGAELRLPLRAARWLAPDADTVAALAMQPTECLSPVAGADHAFLVEVGRSAFRTPLLLGGQAARAGLSCESCHRGGRGNEQFLFTGVSGAAGTADVTSSLLSSHRGDGVFNPKPIPDLSGPRERLKVSRDPANRDLENFIRGLVVEEFDGAEPPPRVLQGLAAYVRVLSPEACPPEGTRALHAGDMIAEAKRALDAAGESLRRGDAATAALMVSAARSHLALAHERYDGRDLEEARAVLRNADLDLAAALSAIRAADRRAGERLAVWLSRADILAATLARHEMKSLFNPERLATN